MRPDKLNLDPQIDPIDTTEARMRAALGLGSSTGSGGPAHAPPSHAPAPSPHEGARPRRRFAQDGDVPVVVLSRSREAESDTRATAMQASLREEKDARIRAQRGLEEAQSIIQSLKTKLAHAEMAFEERLRAAQEARTQAEAARQTAEDAQAAAEDARATAEAALTQAEARLALTESVLAERKRAAERPTPAEPKPRVKPPVDAISASAPVSDDLFGSPPEAAAKPRRGRKPANAPSPTPVVEEEEQPIEWWLPSFRAHRNSSGGRKRKAK